MHATVLILLVLNSVGQAQAPKEPDEQEKAAWLDVFTKTAADHEIMRIDGKKKEKLELRAKPILRWTNLVRSRCVDGADFVWLYRGRPAVVGSFWALETAEGGVWSIGQYIHSLDVVPLDATWRGKRLWNPQKPGVAFKPVPGGPEPAETPELRARQMRGLIRNFTAKLTDAKGDSWELRLLPQPVYRYETDIPDVLDGGLFAFVQGNDCEALLLLEARRPANGKTFEWQYVCVRFTDLAVQVQHDGSAVWSVLREEPMNRTDASSPWILFYGEVLRAKPTVK